MEAALLTHGDTITTDQLADALDWSLGRLERALGALERRLRPTGARLCMLIHGLPVASKGWEDNDGLQQLRRRQLVDGDQPPFRLSADVRYSVLLEEYPE